MSEAVVARLEAVAARLEGVARKMGAGGGDDEGSVPPYVEDFDRFLKTEVAALVAACEAIKIPEVADVVQSGFANIVAFVRLIPNAKKPKQQDIMAQLKDASAAINAADTMKYRGKEYKKFGDHYKAVYEMVNSMQWPIMESSMGMGTPYSHADAQTQATDFNLNRVLKNNKDEATKKWIAAMKAVNVKQQELLKEYFKVGITWNPKGSDLGSATPASGGAAEEEKSAPAKAGKKKAGAGPAGGMDSVFGDLSKGLNVTSGLKKVTSDMKAKNRKDRSGVVKARKPVAKKVRQKKDPSCKYAGGRWIFENYNEGVHSLDKADMKANVFITTCDDTVVQVPNKVKSVCVDNCIKCKVFVNEVVSTVEVVNCKSVTIVAQKACKTFTVDKSQSPLIILTRPAYESEPLIYHSNVSAMNVQLPGKTDKDDPIEIPIPEQFVSTVNSKAGTVKTDEVKHA